MTITRNYVLFNRPPAKFAPGINKRNSATMLRQTPTGNVRAEIKWDNAPQLNSAYEIAHDLGLSATFALCEVNVEVDIGGNVQEVRTHVVLSGRFESDQDAAKWESLRDQLDVQEKLRDG